MAENVWRHDWHFENKTRKTFNAITVKAFKQSPLEQLYVVTDLWSIHHFLHDFMCYLSNYMLYLSLIPFFDISRVLTGNIYGKYQETLGIGVPRHIKCSNYTLISKIWYYKGYALYSSTIFLVVLCSHRNITRVVWIIENWWLCKKMASNHISQTPKRRLIYRLHFYLAPPRTSWEETTRV